MTSADPEQPELEDEPQLVKVVMSTPACADLFSRIQEQMRSIPGLRDRVQARGPDRFIVAPAAEGASPRSA